MITKEQWQKIEKSLSYPYGSVKLRCDGYDVSAFVMTDKMKLVIEVFVDGFIKGEWLLNEHEIGIKFYEKKTKYTLNKKEREEARKNMNNKRLGIDLREMFKRHYENKYSYINPCWTSAKSFLRHIRKTCNTIELIEEK
ncbi:hypothetical protein [Nitrosomonas oligotropha]|uniref:hypothetical protein n=1 Tax=Nitrosomonas oligotropha TaxID=42354 RepID=UPI00136BA012|nr:hypothetical protein [Nitrosomonas oligotropha]MXS82252.1 hypothetical protein [Nitrosomonas oligotropha]